MQLSALTAADRKLLVKGVLKSSDQDHEDFLRGMRERLDRQGSQAPHAAHMSLALAAHTRVLLAQGRHQAGVGRGEV